MSRPKPKPNSPLAFHIAATLQAQIGVPETMIAPMASIIDSELAGTQTECAVEVMEAADLWLCSEGRDLASLIGDEDGTTSRLEDLICQVENVRAGWGAH